MCVCQGSQKPYGYYNEVYAPDKQQLFLFRDQTFQTTQIKYNNSASPQKSNQKTSCIQISTSDFPPAIQHDSLSISNHPATTTEIVL